MGYPDVMGSSSTEIEAKNPGRSDSARGPVRQRPAAEQDADLWLRLLQGQSAVIELLAKGAGLETALERLVRVIEVAVAAARCAIFVNTEIGRAHV